MILFMDVLLKQSTDSLSLIFLGIEEVVRSVISIAVVTFYLPTKITGSHHRGKEFTGRGVGIFILHIERYIDVLSDEVVGFDFRVPVVACSPLSRNS